VDDVLKILAADAPNNLKLSDGVAGETTTTTGRKLKF